MITFRKTYKKYYNYNIELQDRIATFDETKKETDRLKALKVADKVQQSLSELKGIIKNKRGS